MNRTAVCATLLLHSLLLLTLRAVTGPAMHGRNEPVPGQEAARRMSISVRLPALAVPQAPGLRPRTLAGMPSMRAPEPTLVTLPSAFGAPDASSSGMPSDPPAPVGPEHHAAHAAEASVARTPPAAAQASSPLIPVTLPPEHQACNARQVARHYPALLRDRGIEGRVVVRVKVDEDGRASEVLVQGPSGWRLLDEAARQVAAACPYLPARRGEERLMAWIEYPVRFSLH